MTLSRVERPAQGNTGRRTSAEARRPSDELTSGRGLLRVEEAAEWLGVGRTKAYELVYRGTLASVTIGRSRRIPVSALEAFVTRLIENGGVI
jgi:excisionase family DNA binding protein